MCKGCVLRICQRREDAAECDIWQGLNSCKYQISGSTKHSKSPKDYCLKAFRRKNKLVWLLRESLARVTLFGFFIPHYQGTDLCYSSRSDWVSKWFPQNPGFTCKPGVVTVKWFKCESYFISTQDFVLKIQWIFCPPSNSCKERFRLGSLTKNAIFLVVTLIGRG